ncbi:hypothetical protein C8R44DRAFT_896525 [Mycena epipterygia]|nr:hypothetical protein C8R44DRAFT_896525 [Mycena epipterygia]
MSSASALTCNATEAWFNKIALKLVHKVEAHRLKIGELAQTAAETTKANLATEVELELLWQAMLNLKLQHDELEQRKLEHLQSLCEAEQKLQQLCLGQEQAASPSWSMQEDVAPPTVGDSQRPPFL